jgi:hypothetical protein
MEQKRKHLKVASVIVLAFTGLTFLRTAAEYLFADQGIAILPDGSSVILQLIVRLIMVAIALVFVLPQIYIGVKGLRIAKNPAPAKAHVVWAWILLVFAILGLIEPITAAPQPGGLAGNVGALIQGLLSIVIYFAYIRCARAVAKAL